MIKRLLLALVALAISGGAQAQIQLRSGAALSPRSLPPNVSIPTVTSSSVSYPGCPGEVTSHTNTWYFDQVNGHTQAGGGLGTISAPWDNLNAITGASNATPPTGYTQILLSTASGGNGSSPIKPGDLIIVNTGSYGQVVLGHGVNDGTQQIVNSPAVTIIAGSGQTPLLTGLYTNEATGFHFNALKIQALNTGSGNPLVGISDQGVASSDIILENMDISSATVATSNGWTQAQFKNNANPGVWLVSTNNASTGSSPLLTCASLVNSHLYVLHGNNRTGGLAALVDEAGSSLVQGNEFDHFYPTAVGLWESNVAIGSNYAHDFVATGEGDQQYFSEIFQDSTLQPSKDQFNIYIYNNKVIESIDAGQTFQAAANFWINSTGVVTNFVAWDNLHAGGGDCGICSGNSHDFVIANNSFMFGGTGQNPEINLSQAHAGAVGHGTGPVGQPPSNGWVFNNIAPIFNNANSMQTYHNISAPGSTGFATWTYANGWSFNFVAPTPGSIVTLPSVSGQQNLIDGGVGGAAPQANEFTAVPAASSFPMSPQPNWTPKSGSPAKTAGGVQLVPPLTDYNGATFTSPYSIGALN